MDKVIAESQKILKVRNICFEKRENWTSDFEFQFYLKIKDCPWCLFIEENSDQSSSPISRGEALGKFRVELGVFKERFVADFVSSGSEPELLGLVGFQRAWQQFVEQHPNRKDVSSEIAQDYIIWDQKKSQIESQKSTASQYCELVGWVPGVGKVLQTLGKFSSYFCKANKIKMSFVAAEFTDFSSFFVGGEGISERRLPSLEVIQSEAGQNEIRQNFLNQLFQQ